MGTAWTAWTESARIGSEEHAAVAKEDDDNDSTETTEVESAMGAAGTS